MSWRVIDRSVTITSVVLPASEVHDCWLAKWQKPVSQRLCTLVEMDSFSGGFDMSQRRHNTNWRHLVDGSGQQVNLRKHPLVSVEVFLCRMCVFWLIYQARVWRISPKENSSAMDSLVRAHGIICNDLYIIQINSHRCISHSDILAAVLFDCIFARRARWQPSSVDATRTSSRMHQRHFVAFKIDSQMVTEMPDSCKRVWEYSPKWPIGCNRTKLSALIILALNLTPPPSLAMTHFSWHLA